MSKPSRPDEHPAPPSSGKTAIVLQTHFVDRSTIRSFKKLRSEMPPDCEAFILLHVREGTPRPQRLEDFPHHFVTTPEIRTPDYPNKSAIGREWHIWKGGNTDLSALHFYRDKPNFDTYWFIEYDVCFSGKWSALFAAFKDSSADLLTTSLRRANNDPNWMHWWTLQPPDPMLSLDSNDKVCGFMPIFRVSRQAMGTIDRAYREGWTGHCEATWPTIINLAGLNLEDIGGEGEFVAPGNQNRFYTNTLSSPVLSPGSLVMRPARCWLGSQRNKLWHPIKPLMFKLREDARSATPIWFKRIVRSRHRQKAAAYLVNSPS
jgi:hypothetical protein